MKASSGQEGEWRWDTDGSLLNSTVLDVKEDSNRNKEHCLKIANNGHWSDASCRDETIFPICNIPEYTDRLKPKQEIEYTLLYSVPSSEYDISRKPKMKTPTLQ